MDSFAYLDRFDLVLGSLPKMMILSLLIALLSLLFLIAFYFYLLYKRLVFIYYRSRNQYWLGIISDTLTQFLLFADDLEINDPVEKILPEMEKLPLKKRYIEYLLYRQILDYHTHFTGNTALQLRALFLQLGLNKITRNKLMSLRKSTKIRGIMEAAQLRQDEFIPLISQMINSKSPEIRMEAQAALITLDENHSFAFLSDLNEPILQWHQLVLLELAAHKNLKKLPDFSNWLYSDNHSVVKLCIKLIAQFQQFQAIPKLIELLKSADEEIQRLAIKVLGEFEAADAEEQLLHLYKHSEKAIRVEIIKALGRISSQNQLDFLLEKASSHQFEIAYQAINALKNHGEKGNSMLRQFYPQANQINKDIIRQLTAYR